MRSIYADEFLFLNLLANCAVLYITAYTARLKYKKLRLWLSALLGAVYAFLSFVFYLPWLNLLLMKILLSVVMVAVAFGFCGVKNFIRGILFFYISSFALGGGIYAVLSATGRLFDGGMTLKIFICSVFLIFAVMYLFETLRERYSIKHDCLFDIEITLYGKKVSLTALADTGNLLFEPFTNAPVVVVEFEAVEELLPGKTEPTDRLRFIPYKSIGEKGGLLRGIKPDRVAVGDKEIKGAVLAFSTYRLGTEGSYRAVFNPNNISGGENA